MNPFLHGFTDELCKVGTLWGGLKRVGGFAKKHPLLAFGAGATGIGTGIAAIKGYHTGLQGDEKPRYVAAGIDDAGNAQASDAAYTNYHQLFAHKPTNKQVAALSKNYDPAKFKR